jgi:D-alanine-D-alanine ligase
MSRKTRVGVLCGGKSAEHEVSLKSARNVVEAIDKEKYEVVLIAIDKSGQWFLNDAARLFLEASNPDMPAIQKGDESDGVSLVTQGSAAGQLVRTTDHQLMGPVDVMFPVLHGPYGEDGTVQGLLKLANIPFVGAGVLGSAVGMDKDVMKRLLRDAGIPGPDFLTFNRKFKIDYGEIVNQIGTPFYVKPANLGSSVGVSRVKHEDEFDAAVKEAFRYDNKIILEENIEGREVECSVLGNEDPVASTVGEVIPRHEFYSYEAKYLDEKGANLEIPADLPPETVKTIQDLAIRAFQVLCCEGMARADFFLRGGDEVLVNEINTIPGFTKISMYPKLWEASGVTYSELIDKLIQLALERHGSEQTLQTSLE